MAGWEGGRPPGRRRPLKRPWNWGGVPGKGSGAQRCPWHEGGEGLVAPSRDLGRVYTIRLPWEWGRLTRCLIGEGFDQICVWNRRPGLNSPALLLCGLGPVVLPLSFSFLISVTIKELYSSVKFICFPLPTKG